jgi:hypothetical protein
VAEEGFCQSAREGKRCRNGHYLTHAIRANVA